MLWQSSQAPWLCTAMSLCPHQPDALALVDAMAQGNSRQDRALEEQMGMLEFGSGIPEPGEALSGMEEQGRLRAEL